LVFSPIYRGWGLRSEAGRRLKQSITRFGLSREARQVADLAERVEVQCRKLKLETDTGQRHLAEAIAADVLGQFHDDEDAIRQLPLFEALSQSLHALIVTERWFALPAAPVVEAQPARSELWAIEDGLKRTERILTDFDATMGTIADLYAALLVPIIDQVPALLIGSEGERGDIRFETALADTLDGLPDIVEAMLQYPFAPELEEQDTVDGLRARLQYNLILASGGTPDDPRALEKATRFPTKAPAMPAGKLIDTYLGGTPLADLFDVRVPITIPEATRFEHQHIIAGSGHGKTQTLQHFILHDLDAVAAGEASIIVIDSQSDLINTIAGLDLFAPDGPLADRFVLVDPTDVEWPVALNLFDFGLDRIDQYSPLDRERLINGVLELYDFVLGSLLDAGLTQKQTVIFRYITRLLLHIPNATIHTFRELLEDGGLKKYRPYVDQLTGSARAFFETEFESREFVSTRKQVLRRLYGILENQTFERMFSHPKSKLDLFAEMNAGKVILINTAKDLLKENGTEIFGRFFIAMIAQAAQERAVLARDQRMPTFVYVDEANDYFDRTIGVILSQARKYNIGLILAHQFLGQLDTRLYEAIAANTAIKFAGGVSAKDARTLAGDLRTDAAFIETEDKLSFAAMVRGTTKRAVSIGIEAGRMEARPRMSDDERDALRDAMRERYAVHYSQIGRSNAAEEHGTAEDTAAQETDPPEQRSATDSSSAVPADDEPDSGEPMKWE
jgi:DNA helicase HerA-like ATPase